MQRRVSFAAKQTALDTGRNLLHTLNITPDEANAHGFSLKRDGRRRSAFELLAFPNIDTIRLSDLWPELASLSAEIATQLEIDAVYDVYLRRQAADVEAYKRDEAVAIPSNINYSSIAGLSTELRHKLEKTRPATLAQASSIDGITPAALMLVLAHIRRTPNRVQLRD
jgi:tRNA uridine 5-carboxymethylaminomethyl modification enzyme